MSELLASFLRPTFFLAQVDEAAAGVGRLAAVGGIFIVLLVVGLALFVFWLWMLISAIKRQFPNKGLWIAILILGGWLGALIYYFAVHRELKHSSVSGAGPAPMS